MSGCVFFFYYSIVDMDLFKCFICIDKYNTIEEPIIEFPIIINGIVDNIIDCNYIIITCREYENSTKTKRYYVTLNNVSPFFDKNIIVIKELKSILINKHVIITNITNIKQNQIYGEMICDNINISSWLIENNYGCAHKNLI
jgi:hypothetical protein